MIPGGSSLGMTATAGPRGRISSSRTGWISSDRGARRTVREGRSVMPDFVPHAIDWTACQAELNQLKALLDSSSDLGEAALRDLLEPSLHLRAVVGLYNSSVGSPDRL